MLSMKSVFLTILLLVVIVFSAFPKVLAYNREDADKALSEAMEAITTCYEAAVNAEMAGANITELVVTLNAAGNLYSKALLAYKKEDFNLTVRFARESQNVLDGFVLEADALREAASEQRYWDFMINVVGSTVGTFAVILVSFALWTLLKRKYSGEGRISHGH
jgi:hypothetical protein